uniref:NADP-dependent malic enzyme (Fragments) n=1 Tax=Populus euphratica TaxID=75702 RepID=MAOX_POPEU|nr:RecName: Full=NADP-dependent malic enzyme; Short=NADP-ME [Populus euphratica]
SIQVIVVTDGERGLIYPPLSNIR